MLVSILIAAYNVENYLHDCLNSCVNQTYSEIEIIVVNDGSTDSTKLIAENFKLTDSRVKVINQSNGGLVSARKAGVENAKGQYLFFLDGDDNLPENAIKSLISGIENGTKIVVANYNIISENDESKIVSYGFKAGKGIDLLNCVYQNSLCNIWGNLYSYKLFSEIEYPLHLYKSIGEDLVLLTQLACKNVEKVSYVNETTYNYIKRNSSIIGKASNTSIWALGFGAFVFVSDFLKHNKIDELVKVGYLKLLGTYVIGYIVSDVPFELYKESLNTAIIYALKNYDEFKLNHGLIGKTIIILAKYNLFLSRIIGKFIQKIWGNIK